MPSIRVGFGSDYTLKNQRVGIGTDNPAAELDVRGTLKGDFNITGVSTLRVYGGFTAQKQNITKDSSIGFSTTGIGTVGITSFISVNERETGFLSLVGEYNTLSEDLIVDEGKIFEISTTNITGITTLGTQEVYAPDDSVVSVGTLESVSIQSHFSVPDGGSNDRPDQPTEGMVRFNDDLNTLEFYNGIEWRQFTVSGASGRGVFAGGASGSPVTPSTTFYKTIRYINIHALGNTQNFGELVSNRSRAQGCGSEIRGIFGGGYSPSPTYLNEIEYITIASEGNSIDFGDLTGGQRGSHGSGSSSTRGLFAGGYGPGDNNAIDYIEIQTTGSSLDFGDIAVGGPTQIDICSSPTRAVFGGGTPGNGDGIASFVTFSSKGNSVFFGNLNQSRRDYSTGGNIVRGLYIGGAAADTLNSIEYITIASNGNGTDFGDLSYVTRGQTSVSTQTRCVITSGQSESYTRMDYVTISTTGNAQDFGDANELAYNAPAGVSDSHGGLGGF